LKDLSNEELELKLDSLRKNMFDLNSQRKFGKVEKPHLFKVNKRDIARILTILKERNSDKQ